MYRPRIKWEHRPVRIGARLVRIGGTVPKIAANVTDPDGWVWALLGALDGMRTVDQIITELVHRFPGRSAADVLEDLGALVRAGYVENAAEPPPAGLTIREQERYSRSRALWQWMDRTPRQSSWDTQLLLRQARVTVVGVGGAGSTAALSLAMSGVGTLHLVEPDRVDLSNLNRQILYTEQDIGEPKLDVALRRLRAHNSDITVTGEALTITGPSALAALAAGCDVLVLTADSPAQIRSWTNESCLRTGTNWVHSGYHGPQINLGLYRPGGGPCYDCAYVAARERESGLPTTTWPPTGPADELAASSAVSAGIAGHLVAHAAMSLITGAPRLPANREYGLNLVTLDDSVVLGLTKPRADCPACATK
ncbi:ThiF family adenylyltransferase [Kutzneria sp. NPDC052558]|uniref:ThiF family adenylyltransferase n=1 Tax=Kutzneria sp. NPDC052558 TaxID=3364121 RepID=UPI0037C869EF